MRSMDVVVDDQMKFGDGWLWWLGIQEMEKAKSFLVPLFPLSPFFFVSQPFFDGIATNKHHENFEILIATNSGG